MHMPGHKGRGELGIEHLDITEVSGADVLYTPSGIIAESEENATRLFSTAHTYYSAEGSTLAIKAMLALALEGKKSDTPPTVLAARNVHKAFVNAAALLDFTPVWLMGEGSHLCECRITPEQVCRALSSLAVLPCAVYITTPDYLGNMLDVGGIAEVCKSFSVPLLVDNAHGAYLAFTEPSLHPIALGAAMCADSAHKTLPVLTGGAYLHISKDYPHYTERARSLLSVFASTSPSYLTLASLDLANAYLADGYSKRLCECIRKVERIKKKYALDTSVEPLKIVIQRDISDSLRTHGIECELADGERTVLMLTPDNTDGDFARLDYALSLIDHGACDENANFSLPTPIACTSVREAVFSPSERVHVSCAVGRVVSTQTVSCPPAVPIAVSGELITDTHVALFRRYGIEYVDVIK